MLAVCGAPAGELVIKLKSHVGFGMTLSRQARLHGLIPQVRELGGHDLVIGNRCLE